MKQHEEGLTPIDGGRRAFRGDRNSWHTHRRGDCRKGEGALLNRRLLLKRVPSKPRRVSGTQSDIQSHDNHGGGGRPCDFDMDACRLALWAVCRRRVRAWAADIVRRALGTIGTYVLSGAALGLILAMLTAKFLGGLLFEIQPVDTVTYVGVMCAIALTAAAVFFSPIYRVTRIRPVDELRRIY